MTTRRLSPDEYVHLAGLLALAASHRRALEAIDLSACALTGDEPGGHTSDAVWGDLRIELLMRNLELGRPEPAELLAALAGQGI